MGHRYYDSSTGRFLTRDPAKDGRNWYGYCSSATVGAVDDTGLAKIIIVRGDSYDQDKGLFDDIIDDIVRGHPDDEIIIVDSAEEVYDEVGSADELYWVGHYDPIMQGEWMPDYADFSTREGDMLSPYEISRIRKGRPLRQIALIGCNTLTNPANAAAWARIYSGNLWGTYYALNIKFYAWGWTSMPSSKLVKYDPSYKPKKTWYGPRKKGKGVGIGVSCEDGVGL